MIKIFSDSFELFDTKLIQTLITVMSRSSKSTIRKEVINFILSIISNNEFNNM